MILRPQRNFTVVRQIANHTDSTTYYVQAVIRDAYTDAILQTLNLTDKGGQRFKGDWKVAEDPSGEGREISIVTSVYTDSGYTTKSPDYGDEETSYVIEAKLLNQHGGGMDVYDVKRVITEALNKFKETLGSEKPEPVEPPETEEPETMKKLEEILSCIEELKTTLKPEKVNMNPVMDCIDNMCTDICEKMPEEVDLSPVIIAIKDINDKIQGFKKFKDTKNEKMIIKILDIFKNKFSKLIKDEISSTEWTDILKNSMDEIEKEKDDLEKEKESEKIDINQLTK